jgi:hypothetical protein
VRYSPDGDSYVDVCPLCQETALEHGWIKEGSPTTPVVADRRRRSWLSSFLGDTRRPAVEPVADEPILRRLSEPELAMVEAADLFNESAFRRTIAGIAKSLGVPKASIVPLSGTSNEVVLTVAWDISWYQYRISPDSGQPVRLAEPGHLTGLAPTRAVPTITGRMIYCVIPRELEDELFDKMVEYYKDNPNVTVIVDRREGEDRRRGRVFGGKREIRDRRRARAAGTFPETDAPE